MKIEGHDGTSDNAHVSSKDSSASFQKIIDMVIEKSPAQEKRIGKFISEQNAAYWKLTDSFMASFSEYLESEGLSLSFAVDSYIQMCDEMLSEQITFLRTGGYSCKSFEEANISIYSDNNKMKAYMHGLMLSQFLWKNHFLILQFYMDAVRATPYDRCIEIGSGHGMFLVQAALANQEATYNVVDISQESIRMTKGIVSHFLPSLANISFQVMDITERIPDEKYDFIVFGEVLEHVENPAVLLGKIKGMMANSGKCFITTCANCPAVDHIYLFNCVEEITAMIENCGFVIEKNLQLPVVENIAREKWEKRKVGVNYAALISHA